MKLLGNILAGALALAATGANAQSDCRTYTYSLNAAGNHIIEVVANGDEGEACTTNGKLRYSESEEGLQLCSSGAFVAASSAGGKDTISTTPPAPCNAENAGMTYIHAISGKSMVCFGGAWQSRCSCDGGGMKLCETADANFCLPADTTTCGAAITHQCGGTCTGTGTACPSGQMCASGSCSACDANDQSVCPAKADLACGTTANHPCVGGSCPTVGEYCPGAKTCIEGACVAPPTLTKYNAQRPGRSYQVCASHGHSFVNHLWAHKYCVEMGHDSVWSSKIEPTGGACDYPDNRDSLTNYWNDPSGWTHDGSHSHSFSEIVCASGAAAPKLHFYSNFPTFNLGEHGAHALCGAKGPGIIEYRTADLACKAMGHQGAMGAKTGDSPGGSCWYYSKTDALEYDGGHGTLIKDVICYSGFSEEAGSAPPARIFSATANMGAEMGVPVAGEWEKIVICAGNRSDNSDPDTADAFCQAWGYDKAYRYSTTASGRSCAFKGSDNDTPQWDDPLVWALDGSHGTWFDYIHCENVGSST